MKALGCIFYTEVSSLTLKQKRNESVENTFGGMNARNYMPPCFVPGATNPWDKRNVN
jgi:hypothetical protein